MWRVPGTRRQLPDTQPRLVFAYPGDLATPTGGYGYDRRIIDGLGQLGWRVSPLSLGEGFPFPDEKTRIEAERQLSSLPDQSRVVIDGLALGAMGDAISELGSTVDLIALVHHPLCLENGLSETEAAGFRQSENLALQHACRIVVTSPATADQVQELFGIPPERINVVLPGTDRCAFQEKPETDRPRLLSVGTISPRKGYDLLFKALAELKQLDWELGIAGAVHFDPDCYAELQELLKGKGLEDRVTFYGAVDPDVLSGMYEEANIFVLASRYEGYGMAYTEALAHGLPVIGSGAGAVKDTLPADASVYCGIEDVDRLKNALRTLIGDPKARQAMGQAARIAADNLPTWTDAAKNFAMALGKKA